MLSVSHGNLDSSLLLIEMGANIHAIDAYHRTAMHRGVSTHASRAIINKDIIKLFFFWGGGGNPVTESFPKFGKSVIKSCLNYCYRGKIILLNSEI